MKAHTPGPWTLFDGKSSSQNGCQFVNSGAINDVLMVGKRVATVHEDTEEFGVWTPDARLIAAAPDLLEALKKCEVLITVSKLNDKLSSVGFFPVNEALTDSRAAIAKAQGGQ